VAAPRSGLRAVGSDEKPPRKAASKTVAQAAASGDHKALLVAMRGRIAQTVSDPSCPPRDLAALTRRLQDIAKDLEAIELREKQEGEDAKPVPDAQWDSEAL
jgi:hypothetical protein